MQRKRNPNETRRRILEAAFTEIHQHGFGPASLDDIAARSEVTKGALYHHFPNKSELGYAVVDEILAGYMAEEWKQCRAQFADPIDMLVGMLESKHSKIDGEAGRFGCPLNNLLQEMSSHDDGFRERLEQLLRDWAELLRTALVEGIEAGQVRPDIDPASTAEFIVAAVEGISGVSKGSRDRDAVARRISGFRDYLISLRADRVPPLSTAK